MAFEIKLKNGYTGETAKMITSTNETPEMLIERLRAIWHIPANPHTLLYDGRILERDETFSSSKIRDGAKAEVVPDPKVGQS